jgi:hypothetical protein
MNLNLLEDYSDIGKYTILESEIVGGERTYRLRGSLGRCDFPNKNKRIYPMSVMRPVIEGLQEAVRDGRFVGELDHPPTPKINMEKISHKITQLSLTEDGHIIGEIIPTTNTQGKELNALLRDGIKVGVSTRGTGAVKPYSGNLGEGFVEVQPGFRMFAIDVVWDPSASTIPDVVLESYEDSKFNSFRTIWDMSFRSKK